MSGMVDSFRTFVHFDDPILVLMLVGSVLIVALSIERLVAILRARGMVRKAEALVLPALQRGELDEAQRQAEALPAPVRDVFVAGIVRARGAKAGPPRAAMLRAQKRVAAQLKSMLWMLGTSGALMPFVGLLGTVLGVMGSFKAIGETGAGGFQVVSTGISAALIATAIGLFVALEAIVFFNILQNLAVGVLRDLGLLVDESLELLESRADHAGTAAGK